MNISLNFFVVCENILTDNKNRTSLINIYDVIYARSFPAQHEGMKIAANFDLTQVDRKTDIPVSLTMIDPDGKQVMSSDQIVEQPATKREKKQLLFQGQPIPLASGGEYILNLKLGDQTFSQLLSVRKIEQGED